MSDVVARAREALKDYEFAHACGCEPVYPRRLLAQLVAELEQARTDLEHLRGLQREDRDTIIVGELPKPSYTDAEGDGCGWTGKPGDGRLSDWSVYVISGDVCSDVRVYAQNSGGVTPAQARTIASFWWLAAATAAENHP